MHHIEGALSGLPIIYKNSGALPEYCKNYGVCFNNLEFIKAIEEMISNYDIYKKNLKNYPNTATQMSKNYLDLFNELKEKNKLIVANRKLFRSPIYLLKNLIFIIIYLIKHIKLILQKI